MIVKTGAGDSSATPLAWGAQARLLEIDRNVCRSSANSQADRGNVDDMMGRLDAAFRESLTALRRPQDGPEAPGLLTAAP